MELETLKQKDSPTGHDVYGVFDSILMENICFHGLTAHSDLLSNGIGPKTLMMSDNFSGSEVNDRSGLWFEVVV